MYFSKAIRFRNQIAAGVQRANGNTFCGVSRRGARVQSSFGELGPLCGFP